MYKRLLLLNGLAIFAVVCNHAGWHGQMSIYLWADSGPVEVPDWTQLGTISHYFLLIFRQISVFCVPAFFFVCGSFVSYAALDKNKPLNWVFVWNQLKKLLIPYLMWSMVVVIGDLIKGDSRPALEYLKLIATFKLSGSFWFIIVLCFCYLFSPLLVPFVKWNWKVALVISGLIQFIFIVNGWLRYAGLDSPLAGLMWRVFPSWSPFQWIFYFTLGISAGFHFDGLKQFVVKYRTLLFFLVLFTGLLNIIEADYLMAVMRKGWGAYNLTISYNLYVITFILWFLSLATIPLSNYLNPLGVRSYGIYLLHYPIIEWIAWKIYIYIPQLLAYQIVFIPLLVLAGLGIPLLIMTAVRRSPIKQYYRYLFG